MEGQPQKQRNLRKKRTLEELEAPEGEEEGPALTAEDIKLLQRRRQRRTGTDAVALAVADTSAPAEADKGPAAGGPEVLEAAFKRERLRVAEEEDPHMKQYIEEQLAQRMGRRQREEEEAAAAAAQRPAPDDLDALLPETLKPRQVDTELGPSWVAGISEVPLTVEQKLANIEETEAAKNRILARSMALMTRGAGDEDGGGRGPSRTAFPVRFGRLNPDEEARIEKHRTQKAEQREFHYKKRVSRKERNARAPAWL
eukprot:scaffold5.g791.t1